MGLLRVRHVWATSFSCIGEGNGNPLQCSCLENPRHGGAWWATVYGVTQSRTRLKWLSSSSSNLKDCPLFKKKRPSRLLPCPGYYKQCCNEHRCRIQDVWGWCTGMTQRDGMGREVGAEFRMGNTCTPMVDSCWCMAKPIQYCEVISL